MNLLLLDRTEIDADNVATITDVRARHIRQVLGAEPGRALRIGLIDGSVGTGTVVAIDDRQVRLACAFDVARPPLPRVDLLLALPRPKVLQRLWAQIAALGVGRILLTNAARVERHYFDTHVLDEATYRPLLIEGLQQARDTRVPRVSVHRQFRVLVEDDLDRLCPQATRLLADPAPDSSGDACDALETARTTSDARVLLAAGPEGGWNDFERRLLISRGFQPFSLGPRTLRSDTACIALLTLVHAALSSPRPRPRG